jgi:hypothetical protein
MRREKNAGYRFSTVWVYDDLGTISYSFGKLRVRMTGGNEIAAPSDSAELIGMARNDCGGKIISSK